MRGKVEDFIQPHEARSNLLTLSKELFFFYAFQITTTADKIKQVDNIENSLIYYPKSPVENTKASRRMASSFDFNQTNVKNIKFSFMC